MSRQLYAIGQIVSVAQSSLTGPRTADHFRIVRRYLIDGRPAMYHIRSLIGRGERMVPERELSSVMPTVFGPAGRPSKVLQLFPEVVQFERGVTR